MKKQTLIIVFSTLLLFCISCSVAYKFNGASIDYSKTKTICINDFTNRAQMVYPPLTDTFNESLKDLFSRQTRLSQVSRNGDMEIEGEIVGYDIAPMAIQANAIAAETRLSVRINVRFTNNKNSDEDFERSYTSYRNFDSSYMLNDVQDELIAEITKELVEYIYNDTVANW